MLNIVLFYLSKEYQRNVIFVGYIKNPYRMVMPEIKFVKKRGNTWFKTI